MPSRRWNGCSFLSIDPGINHTGIAHYTISNGGDLRLWNFEAISPPRNLEDDFDFVRVSYITGFLKAYISTRCKGLGFVFLERPPNTIYHQGKATRNMLIARAQSVFKVIGVTYSIAMLMREFTGLTTIGIDPVHWQERSRKKRGGLDIKDWSLKLANTLICQLSPKPAALHTERDINIADAIAMGYISYQKLN